MIHRLIERWSVLVLAWKLLIVPTFWFHEWLVHALKIFPISYVISHSSLFSGCVMLAEPSILGHNQKSPVEEIFYCMINMEVSEITYWTAKLFHETWLTTETICVMHHHLTLFSLLWEDKMGSHHVKSNWNTFEFFLCWETLPYFWEFLCINCYSFNFRLASEYWVCLMIVSVLQCSLFSSCR